MAIKPLSLLLSFVLSYCLIIPTSFKTLHGDGMLASPLTFSLRGNSNDGCDEDFERKSAYCNSKGFDSVPKNLSADVERLFLIDNNITFLFSFSFQRYRRIMQLDLSYNDIRVIEATAFYPLKELRHLSLTNNHHLALPALGLFRWARNLSYLDLSASNLKVLPNDTLKWSPWLLNVRLYRNKFTFINISSCGKAIGVSLSGNKLERLTAEDFTFTCRSDILDLIRNPIGTVDPDVIASLKVSSLTFGGYPMTKDILRNISIGISRSEINKLRINEADLKVLPEDIFNPLSDYPLSLLDLSSNQLNALYPFVFSNLTQLAKLHLNINYLDTIDPNFFHGMRELRVLELDFNKMTSVNPNNRKWTLDLNEMHLSGNLLTEIMPLTFLGLGNLTLLDLSYNENLAVLELGTFSELDNLQSLDLSECSIYRWTLDTPMLRSLFLNTGNTVPPLVPGVSFDNAQFIEYMEIKDMGLQGSHLWDATVNVSLFDGLLNLTTLHLSRNPGLGLGRNLPPGIFRQLSVLQELSLDECGIPYLHPRFFTGLASLRTLNLLGNNIHQLHYDILKESIEITSINFAGNILSYLDATLFSNNPMLETLTLSSNRLTGFNKSTFDPITTSPFSIDISMNPIDCNCELEWFVHWLTGPNILVNKRQTICSSASLEPFREKPLVDYDPSNLCRTNYALFCLIPLAILCLIIFVVVIHRNRWQLGYKLFLLKLAILGYNEMQDARDQHNYEFDVNIIFYDDDEKWIREHLRPALEEHLPQFQRNVFGDGDLVLGMHYLDSVDYVVTRSYKTVLVISRAAVRDRWFMLKFRTAMDHVSDTHTEFVVVIFIEDIPDEELPFLARLYLSDGRPYIHWTEDMRGQEYFWNEFAKNLTINLKTNDLIPNE